ncbi:hypothetical protein M5K25_011616 [Dendrobium thyrsiflorum]|uniref:Uncharacterized protein n=1 Tax=Dendrobium thyrsiflorum TaxID=117978 RepID=A0ABD0V3N1_DENTH
MHEDAELFESKVDPYVEFVGTTDKGKRKIGVSNMEFEHKLERSNFEVDCMDSNDDAIVHSGEENDHTK